MPTPFSQFIKDNLKREELVGVEIGVFQGINAVYFLQELPIKKQYLVDNYKPYWDGGGVNYAQEQMDAYYSEAIKATEPYFEKTRFIIKDSVSAEKLFPDNYFDFVYIDAGHTYNEATNDIIFWWDKCKTGGVFGGHDYGTVNGTEVKKAVDDFLKEKGITTPPSIGMRVGEAMEWAIVK